MLVGNLVEAHPQIRLIYNLRQWNPDCQQQRDCEHSPSPSTSTRPKHKRGSLQEALLWAFRAVNCSSSNPILQTICFNLNQDFSSPLLWSHPRALERDRVACPHVIILMKTIRAWWLLITWPYHPLKGNLMNQKAWAFFLNSRDKAPKREKKWTENSIALEFSKWNLFYPWFL